MNKSIFYYSRNIMYCIEIEFNLKGLSGMTFTASIGWLCVGAESYSRNTKLSRHLKTSGAAMLHKVTAGIGAW